MPVMKFLSSSMASPGSSIRMADGRGASKGADADGASEKPKRRSPWSDAIGRAQGSGFAAGGRSPARSVQYQPPCRRAVERSPL